MRNLNDPAIDRYRIRDQAAVDIFGWVGDATCGAFVVPSQVDRQPLVVIAADGDGWDHVSVSRKNRVPNWYEMEQVKRLFFGDETVMQLHVPKADHINEHPYVLHLWRPQHVEIPRPPGAMVGIGTDAERAAIRKRMLG